MVFWRKKKNQSSQEQEMRDEQLLHPKGAPEIEPPVEYDSDISEDDVHRLNTNENQIIEEADTTPIPANREEDDADLDSDEVKGGWLSRLGRGLNKSSARLGEGLVDLVVRKKLDAQAMEALEEVLITADLGPKTAHKIVTALAENRFDKDISDDELRDALSDEITAILDPVAKPLSIGEERPYVILVCGVNGVGKTTTIGKLAQRLQQDGHSIMLAAGDTFRAAAVEQLQQWGQRTHVPVVTKDIGSDAAAVAFEALEQAKAQKKDVLMIDTAGRLHNKKGLMDELAKIVRVLQKQEESAPHAIVLVLDGTTGQNAHAQLEAFKDMLNVTGLVVTKLDGSAKGGVVVSLADQFGIPVHAVGVGEGVGDLSPFEARHYANALVGKEENND